MRKLYTQSDVIKAVADNKSVAGVLRQLGLRAVGGNYKTINRYIIDLKLDISHFTGQGWNVGLKWQGQKIPLEIHHKNGINSDNSLSNLELLYPNCHALTDHYRGRAQSRHVK